MLVKAAPRENEDVQVDPQDCDLFRRHFSRSFYQVSMPGQHCVESWEAAGANS